jgi:hypothetical protein
MKLIQTIKATDGHGRMNLVYVQSIFPKEDVIALKKKTGESNIMDAVSKAVYHYLNCQKTNEDNDLLKKKEITYNAFNVHR